MEVRPATDDDQPAIRAVHDAAFEGTLEGDIAAALLASGEERISLVAADDDDAIVGHVVLSAGRVGDAEVLCLGPIGVLPEHQGRSTGSALVRAALAEAAETESSVVVLVGHPGYYPRFGFEPARALGLECKWDLDEPWMALRLPRYDPALRGLVSYPAAFG